MSTIKFVLLQESDNSQIYIRVSAGREINLRKKTGLTINSKDWSKKTNLPKTNDDSNKLLKTKLEELSLFVNKRLNDDLTTGQLITNDWLGHVIDECFQRVVKTDLSVLVNYIQKIIDDAPTRKNPKTGALGLSTSTIKNYRMFKNIVIAYQKHKKKELQFKDISKSFTEDFKNWLIIDKKYSINYAGRQLEFIKTICRDAELNGFIVPIYSTRLETFRLADDDRYIHTLSFKDLEKIKQTEMPTPHLTEVKKWLLLGCAIGQRGGDLFNLTSKNIRLESGLVFIDLKQEKTKKEVTIPVLDEDVINIILNDFPQPVSFKRVNPFIKEVCEVAKIDEVVKGYHKEDSNQVLTDKPKFEFITSHSFRRSFATNFYKKIPTSILIKITGHSTERMFLKYINQKEDKDDNAKLFAMYYTQMMKKEEPVMRVVKSSKG